MAVASCSELEVSINIYELLDRLIEFKQSDFLVSTYLSKFHHSWLAAFPVQYIAK